MPRDIKIIANKIGQVVNADNVTIHQGKPAEEPPARLKVLYLAANPKGTDPLALDHELRGVSDQLRAAGAGGRFELVSAHALRPRDLLQQLNQHRPRIVHFSGHGTAEGGLLLADDDNYEREVSAEALEAMFRTVRDEVRLVVLNACYSAIQGELMRRHVCFVVAMASRISDPAGVAFAPALYGALASRRSLPAAFEQAKAALLLEGIKESETPRLLIRDGCAPDMEIW